MASNFFEFMMSQAAAGRVAGGSAGVGRYTNREFLLQSHAGDLSQDSFLRSLPHSINIEITASPGPQLSELVDLTPGNRVDISFLTSHVGQKNQGKFLLCRVIAPWVKFSSVMTIVDEPAGQLAVQIALYNYVTDRQDVNSILPVGTVLAIKNPWFKRSMDGGCLLRCETREDVVVLNKESLEKITPGLLWVAEIPAQYRRR